MSESKGTMGFAVTLRGERYNPAGVDPVKGVLDAADETTAPFDPINGRAFNIMKKPSGDFSGTYQLEKKFSDDEDWYVVLNYTDLTSLPETFSLTETEAGVSYRFTMLTRTVGSVNVRLSA
jgi:hypothetical protein